MAENICLHCMLPIREINFALGPKWMHIDPNASFPTEKKGTAWEYCRRTRAEPRQLPSSLMVMCPDCNTAYDARKFHNCHGRLVQ